MRKLLFIIGFFVIAIFGMISLAVNAGERSALTINFENISEVSILRMPSGEGDDSKSSSEVASVTHSGESLDLEKGNYYIVYKGTDGYADGQEEVSLSGDKTITLKPDYSDEKLGDMLLAEIPAIQAKLNERYPKIGLYSIQPGKLYQKGDWYGTTLVYIGPYTPYRDTLRLVMKKENGSWKIMTDPPYISLSKYMYPDIPLEILDEVNNLDVPEPQKM